MFDFLNIDGHVGNYMKALIEASMKMQLAYSMAYGIQTDGYFFTEFQVVRLGIPRRAGKTMAIINFIETEQNARRCVMVVGTEFKRRWKMATKITPYIPQQLSGLQGCKYNIVFVDEYNMMSTDQKKMVIDFSKMQAQQCFPFVLCIVSTENDLSLVPTEMEEKQSIRYAIGDVVQLLHVGEKWNRKFGHITRIDGQCYYIRPHGYKHEIELYIGEFIHAP